MPDKPETSQSCGTVPAEQLQTALSDLSAGMEKLIFETMESLAERGIDAYDLAPLMKLRDAVRVLVDIAAATSKNQPEASAPPAAESERLGPYGGDERRSVLKASNELLARVSAIIDLLVQAGQPPEHAAQLITRQLLAVGIQMPESGGDARAWKRLHNWRNNLIHYKRSGPAWDVYCAFKEALNDIPPDQRLRRAVGERLWDRRHEDFSSEQSA